MNDVDFLLRETFAEYADHATAGPGLSAIAAARGREIRGRRLARFAAAAAVVLGGSGVLVAIALRG